MMQVRSKEQPPLYFEYEKHLVREKHLRPAMHGTAIDEE